MFSKIANIKIVTKQQLLAHGKFKRYCEGNGMLKSIKAEFIIKIVYL